MLTSDQFKQKLVKQVVVPSARSMEELENVIENSKHELIMVKFGNVNTLPGIMRYLKANRRKVMLHQDSLRGVARDHQGLEFLANLQVDYLITTKPQLVKGIRKLGMQPILCLFLIDSDALRTGLRSIGDMAPDAVIVMPSSVPKRAVLEIKRKARVPVIGGGMAFDEEAIQDARKNGFHAVAASKDNLWKR
jgi:glycerol uptake operon antiterminator